ncbi:MAG: low-specificity L-threonine aldolase [bacterium]
MMTTYAIDLRSDTITKPSPEMRRAMAEAEVGDDVFGEDPTVNKLQEHVAALLGKQAALFVPTGVMANQIAIKSQTLPGDEIIVEQQSHIFKYEAAGPAVLSGVQLATLQAPLGVMKVEKIAGAIRPNDPHQPRTSLVCLENTHNRAGGTIYPLDEIKKIREYTKAIGIKMHLDGARLWNAWMATGIHPKEYAKYFDSVSVCFSKGLGAPIGSMIAGSEELIAKARRVRKLFGGGMRQVGILAAAAQYAMDHNIERLKEDHEKASYLAERVSQLPGFSIDLATVQTNIIYIDTVNCDKTAAEVAAMLQEKNLLLLDLGISTLRAVTHLDVSFEEIKTAALIFDQISKEMRS